MHLRTDIGWSLYLPGGARDLALELFSRLACLVTG